MGLLDKFFGEGLISKNGKINGRIEHMTDDLAWIYDERGNKTGEIRTDDNIVRRYDNYGNLVSSGSYYDGDEYVNMQDCNTGRVTRVEDHGYSSYSYGSGGYESYNSSTSCYSCEDDEDDDDYLDIWADDDDDW